MVRVTTADCNIWRWFQVLSGQILFCAVELLLITRGQGQVQKISSSNIFLSFKTKKVYAFYGRKRKLLAVLLLLLTAEFSTMISMVVTSLPKEVAKPNPIPHIHAAPCIGISQPKIMSSLWYVKTLEC